MLLKVKKKFHSYLSTYMLHSKLRKEREKNSSALQLSVNYVQKEESWFHTLQTQNINKWGSVPISPWGSGKNRKINKCPLRLLGAFNGFRFRL